VRTRGTMQTRTTTLTEDKLQELAKDSSNRVLRYTYDKPAAIMPPDKQALLYRGIAAAFDAACMMYPDLSDDALREKVLASRPEVRTFQHLYPKVFACSTVRCRTPAAVARLDSVRKGTMMGIVERLKGDGTAEDQKARALEAALRLSLRPATQEELRAAGTTQVDPASLPRGALEPLSPAAFGECTVRQG